MFPKELIDCNLSYLKNRLFFQKRTIINRILVLLSVVAIRWYLYLSITEWYLRVKRAPDFIFYFLMLFSIRSILKAYIDWKKTRNNIKKLKWAVVDHQMALKIIQETRFIFYLRNFSIEKEPEIRETEQLLPIAEFDSKYYNSLHYLLSYYRKKFIYTVSIGNLDNILNNKQIINLWIENRYWFENFKIIANKSILNIIEVHYLTEDIRRELEYLNSDDLCSKTVLVYANIKPEFNFKWKIPFAGSKTKFPDEVYEYLDNLTFKI